MFHVSYAAPCAVGDSRPSCILLLLFWPSLSTFTIVHV